MTEFQLNHFKQALLCLIVTSQLHIAQIFLLQPDGRGIVFSFLICQLKIMVAEYRHVKVHHIAVVLDPLDLPMRLCDTFDPGVRTADADKYIQTALAVDLVNQLQRPQVQIVNEIPCGQWTLHGSLHLQQCRNTGAPAASCAIVVRVNLLNQLPQPVFKSLPKILRRCKPAVFGLNRFWRFLQYVYIKLDKGISIQTDADPT